jgi:hypothetical protein
MQSRFHRIASNLLAVTIGGALFLSAGPAALSTIAEASLVLAQISLDLCQMGLAVLRVCGI